MKRETEACFVKGKKKGARVGHVKVDECHLPSSPHNFIRNKEEE